MNNPLLETPTITTATASSNTYNAQTIGLNQFNPIAFGQHPDAMQMAAYQRRVKVEDYTQPPARTVPVQLKKEPTMTTHRLVQVFIADTNENIPLDKMLMYKGEPTFTDLTDQELFHEIDIKTLLETHNKARVKIRDKAVRERVEHLDPVRIRDLKMSVVVIATF